MRSEWAAPEEDLPLMPDEAGFHATPPARVAPKVEEAMKVVDAMAVVDGRCQVCSYAVYALQPFGAKLLLPGAKAHYSWYTAVQLYGVQRCRAQPVALILLGLPVADSSERFP
jgi:hypothetical protein